VAQSDLAVEVTFESKRRVHMTDKTGAVSSLPNPKESGRRYTVRQSVWATELSEPIELQTTFGILRGKPGDVLVKVGEDIVQLYTKDAFYRSHMELSKIGLS
jgi:hypothetical protein